MRRPARETTAQAGTTVRARLMTMSVLWVAPPNTEYPGDERLEDLVEALALYAPGIGSPYLGPAEIQDVIRQTLEVVEPEKSPLMPP
jgi:hypothetical protein